MCACAAVSLDSTCTGAPRNCAARRGFGRDGPKRVRPGGPVSLARWPDSVRLREEAWTTGTEEPVGGGPNPSHHPRVRFSSSVRRPLKQAWRRQDANGGGAAPGRRPTWIADGFPLARVGSLGTQCCRAQSCVRDHQEKVVQGFPTRRKNVVKP
ncbi:unnamed protein product [Prorocentrum cordatum]|uniref:Uncharacterized protein n=1 Tax=Prorocentrum cordatum TaxID=2364126 RepID=A0ABN9UQQ6_9DINO|nr:unnamed protein product [Polarella glacialis]